MIYAEKSSYTSNRAANYILLWEDLKSLDRHLHVSIRAIIRTVKKLRMLMYEANEATKTCWNRRKKSIMSKRKSPQVEQWYGL